jgi:fructose-1,6-bisphosphatase/inositol monophosphatase family enzyme
MNISRCALACGDFSFYSRIKPWDHLAGVMLFEEAGGYARKWDGSLYRPGEDGGGLISARDENAWQGVRQALL